MLRLGSGEQPCEYLSIMLNGMDVNLKGVLLDIIENLSITKSPTFVGFFAKRVDFDMI